MTKQYKNFLKFGLPVASTTLCVVGTLANLTSLSYFIKKKKKTTGDKLLMLLNSVDLLLCVCATVETALLSYSYGSENVNNIWIPMAVIAVLYILLIDGTAYVTCLLSVTRAIGIVYPFYQIRGKLLVILGIIVFVTMSVLQIPLILAGMFFSEIHELVYARILLSLLVMLTVLFATILAVHKLATADLQGAAEIVSRNNRKASWTVVILSVLFLVFNSILLGVTFFAFTDLAGIINDERYQSLTFYGLFLAIPLNSSINPIVYLTRRSDMRQYFKQKFQNVCHQFRGRA
ncbi:hypothetical protein ACHWQZ_G012754 [Mnemiopsis leidyi]